jgi:hypothetical protein
MEEYFINSFKNVKEIVIALYGIRKAENKDELYQIHKIEFKDENKSINAYKKFDELLKKENKILEHVLKSEGIYINMLVDVNKMF